MSAAASGETAPPDARVFGIRAVLVVLGLAAWLGTQSLLGARQPKSSQQAMEVAGRVLTEGDALHELFSPWHDYLSTNRDVAHGLLIVSSALIDVLGFFLLGWSIFGRSIRPFLGLLILFGLRQISQMICALPAPEGMIWEYPGFPSILVTYSVANDFFFSGHTAIAAYGAVELGRFGGWKIRAFSLIVAVFLALTVIVLRAHYTLDVFAGAVTALYAAVAAKWLAPSCDRLIAGRVSFSS